MTFGLGTFAAEESDPFPGLVTGDRVTDLRSHFGDRVTVLSLLQDWDRSLSRLDDLTSRSAGRPLDELRILPPINPPGAFLCAGANYRMHIIEMRTANAIAAGRDGEQARADATRAMDERAANGIPFMFIGWPGAVIGADDDVIIPGDTGVKHDWELELAVVIGRFARCVSRAEAMDYVAGYTILDDLSTRDRMHRTDLRFTDFLATKGRPTFKPIGPWITPARFVADPHDLRMTLKVNDVVMQDAKSDDMIFSVDRLIEYASGVTDLRPGDIIATGSPSGNAAEHGGRFLRPGDLLEATIEGLGSQRNRCVAAAVSPHGPDFGAAFTAPGA
ncbi:fumarylacetoacetate hydrolase family protein [Actinoplanes subtropicus]|uniref:fumarylacetoacetate hydrolase family protein n=1 Tax=Actinoplanes subtropicus TaxID=543632 RepID=UPI0007C5384C|nr:fumarylacetoacetate hydrolase family protein [Actinoplanes subtropicus]